MQRSRRSMIAALAAAREVRELRELRAGMCPIHHHLTARIRVGVRVYCWPCGVFMLGAKEARQRLLAATGTDH